MYKIQYFCVKFVYNTNMLVEQCVLARMFFGNDQGVRLLELVY